jgi:hypothetical protein
MNPGILNKGQSKRVQLEDGSCMEWAFVVQAKKKDVLSKDFNLVVNFWTIEIRVSPNKRDVMKHHINKKIWEEHASHFLEEP